MSKKKAFTGSTMTLKDFHGGSIPSDLPLPSAPGVIVRPSDRSGYERRTSWANPIGRPEYRSRPSSSPATRNFDDKAPFLTHTARIGRHFDEDERKPLDGVSAPRRTVSDEALHPSSIRVEVKPDLVPTGKSSNRQSVNSSSYSARLAEGTHVGLNSQSLQGNSGHAVSGPYPNAWGPRKEVASINVPIQPAWSESVAVSKLANASALEKVASGRWQTKHTIHQQPDVEVIRYPEAESGLPLKPGKSYKDSGMGVVKERDCYEATVAKPAERSLNVEDAVRGGGKEFPGYERVRSPGYLGPKERNFTLYANDIKSSPADVIKPGELEVQLPVSLEASGRWQTKHSIHQQPDVEVIRYPEIVSGVSLKAGKSSKDSGMGVVKEREYYETTVPKPAIRSLNVEDAVRGGGKEFLGYERVRSPGYLGPKERNFTLYANEIQLSRADVKPGGSEELPPVWWVGSAATSDRWQTKHSIHLQPDVEVIRYPETESGLPLKPGKSYKDSEMGVVKEREHFEVPTVAKPAERSLNVEDAMRGGGKEFPGYERVRSPGYLGPKERNFTFYANEIHLSHADVKPGGSEVLLPVSLEASERPKLKLFPRSKPVETSEPPVVEYKQFQVQSVSAHADNVTEVYENANLENPGSDVADSGNRTIERPKLNLKPRSQPIQQSQGDAERERKTVFGGARPRELVLKERGINEVADNHDIIQSLNRVKQDAPRTIAATGHGLGRHSEKAENLPSDHRVGKNTDRKDQSTDTDVGDMQRRNRRNDSWRNGRETEKQQQQERQRSPDTWRRREQPNPAHLDTPGQHHGRAASAIELAHAFSRSMSDPKMTDRPPGQRGIPSRTQMPFSRLTTPNRRPQINGY